MITLRRALLALSLSLSACAAPLSVEPAFNAFAPREPAHRTTAPASAEADAVVEAYYRDGSAADPTPTIDAALKKAPDHPGLHEIAAYQSVLRGDTHGAFEHFYALASSTEAVAPELAIWEMNQYAQTVSEHLKEDALLKLLAAEHADVSVRAAASYTLAREKRLLGEDPTALVEALGFISSWRAIGPFDNDQGRGFSIEYEPETSTKRTGDAVGLLGPVRFRALKLAHGSDALELSDAVHAGEAVAYVEASVTTKTARALELRLTSSAAVKAWVNGKLVVSEEKITSDELDNVVAKIELPVGDNRILVKSAHRTGAWRLGARLTEVGGAPAQGLHFDAPTSDAPPHVATLTPVEPAETRSLDGIHDPNRKQFLLGRLASRRGHTRQPLSYYEPFLAAAPRNPLAVYYAALAYWDLNEAGKTLDLLNRGALAFPFAPGFLVKRGRFYSQKRLWDKARADLEAAIVKNPNAREAETTLASVDASRGWSLDRCAVLEASLKKWPDSPGLLVDLGDCNSERGAFGVALEHYRRARALMPGLQPAVRRLLDLARRRPDESEAIALVRALRRIAPSSLNYALEEADVLDEFDRRLEARGVLQEAALASPDSPRPLERLGDLAFEDNDRAKAVELYRSALERDPQDGRLAERLDALSPGTRSLADRLAVGDEDIERAIESADKITIDAGSHYAVLLDDEVAQVNADGSAKRMVTIVRQVLNEDGRDNLIQAKLPSFGRVKVVDAYSVKKGADRQEASSVTGSLVRFRSLDVGSIVVLRYVHYAPAGRFLPNEYATEWSFQSVNAQTEKARFRIVLEKARELRVAIRGDVKSATETIEAEEVRTFSADHVPPLVPEPGMPSSSETRAMVSVSTLKDWDAYVRWERALLADAMGDADEIKKLAKKLTREAKTPREKLDRLWAYVAQEIRYQQEYEDTVAGVKPHPPRVVLERGYGDCKDKAVLLLYLAKAVGIELRFALLKTTPAGKVEKDIPNQQFNHAIDYVPKQPGFEDGFFLDSTTNGLDVGNLREDDQGATSLVLTDKENGYEFLEIPYQPTVLEYEKHKLAIDLRDPLHAAATDHLEVRGGTAAQLRIAVRTGEGARKTYQALSDRVFAGTTLVSGTSERAQDITTPLVVDLNTDVANTVQQEGADVRFPVPLQFPLSRTAILATRKLPLVLERGELTSEMTIDVSGSPSRKPQSFKVEHPCFTIDRRVSDKASQLNIVTTFKTTCARIEPADYAGYRASIQKVLAHAQDSVVFRAPTTKPKNVPAKPSD